MARKRSIVSAEWETPSAVVAGDFVFLSGMTSKVPSGSYLAPGDIVGQTHIVIQRIAADLEAAGSSLENVVKVTAFLDDIKKWKLFNDAYLTHFRDKRPARTTVQAGAFEDGACIELDVIAVLSDMRPMEGPAALGPHHAIGEE